MDTSQLLPILVKLREQLATAENLNQNQQHELNKLDQYINDIATANLCHSEQSLTEQILALEIEFSSEHPLLQKLLRETIEKLSMMGI